MFFPLGNAQGYAQNIKSVMDWSYAYLINGVISLRNITLKNFDLSNKAIEKRNKYWHTQQNVNCKFVNNPNGIWEHNSNYKIPQPIVNHKKGFKNRTLDSLQIFGDSLGRYFAISLNKTKLCKTIFQKCKNIYTWVYVKHKYFTEDEERNLYDKKDFSEGLFLRGISDALLHDKDMQSNKSVFVINFGLHLLKAITLKRCFDVFEKFLKLLQSIKFKLGQNTPYVIWKTTTPPSEKVGLDYFRFMTIQVRPSN